MSYNIFLRTQLFETCSRPIHRAILCSPNHLTALEEGVKGGKWFSLMDKVYSLGMPVVRDRVVQTATLRVLEPMYEHDQVKRFLAMNQPPRIISGRFFGNRQKTAFAIAL